MRRAGLILLAVGLAGFLLASSQHARFQTPEGAVRALTSERDRKIRDAWETARWILLGTALMGFVFSALPGRRS